MKIIPTIVYKVGGLGIGKKSSFLDWPELFQALRSFSWEEIRKGLPDGIFKARKKNWWR